MYVLSFCFSGGLEKSPIEANEDIRLTALMEDTLAACSRRLVVPLTAGSRYEAQDSPLKCHGEAQCAICKGQQSIL